MQSLLLVGLGNYLFDFRNGRNYSTMREMFDLSTGSYASFERNERAMPFFLFLTITKKQNYDIEESYEILNNQSEN